MNYSSSARRKQEMADTQARAVELTDAAEGKHHIGDFLPAEELQKFMEKVLCFGCQIIFFYYNLLC